MNVNFGLKCLEVNVMYWTIEFMLVMLQSYFEVSARLAAWNQDVWKEERYGLDMKD